MVLVEWVQLAAWGWVMDVMLWLVEHFVAGLVASGGLLLGVWLAHKALVGAVREIQGVLRAEDASGSPSVSAAGLGNRESDPVEFYDEREALDWDA